MNLRFKLAIAALACSTAAFAQFANSSTPDAFQVAYAANTGAGGPDSFINITNNGASATTAANGNLCINVYAFDPSEEMLSCCSCVVSPNGLAHLSVQNDLLNNTLTGEHPTNGVVIKLVATAAATFSTTSCHPDTEANALAPGMRAWRVTTHTIGSVTGITENEFSKSDLSSQEYSHVTSFCSFILSTLPNGVQNASGFGICNSCKAGALGASTAQ